MPSRRIHKSKSLPILRKLSFAHLAPIPEVPIRMPLNPDIAKIDCLISLLDYVLEESINEFTSFKLNRQGLQLPRVQQEHSWFHTLLILSFHNIGFLAMAIYGTCANCHISHMIHFTTRTSCSIFSSQLELADFAGWDVWKSYCVNTTSPLVTHIPITGRSRPWCGILIPLSNLTVTFINGNFGTLWIFPPFLYPITNYPQLSHMNFTPILIQFYSNSCVERLNPWILKFLPYFLGSLPKLFLIIVNNFIPSYD